MCVFFEVGGFMGGEKLLILGSLSFGVLLGEVVNGFIVLVRVGVRVINSVVVVVR